MKTNHDLHTDAVFAPLTHSGALLRIAGGSETDVYLTDDRRAVVKLKHIRERSRAGALAHARALREAAELFAAYLGARHTIPSHYLLARDSDGDLRVLVVQRFLGNARALAKVNYAALNAEAQWELVQQLRELVRRALLCYRDAGQIPDLHGSFSRTTADRIRLNLPTTWPRRVWDFVMTHSLLRAHNLLLTSPPHRVVLVDYDRVRWTGWRGALYDRLRWMLFWRDHAALHRLARLNIRRRTQENVGYE